MDTAYWASLIIGGVFVLLSVFGGADSDSDVDADLDADFDADVDADLDSDLAAGAGWVDLLSLRTVFLFLAFFGLSGVLLPLAGFAEPLRLIVSLILGCGIGVGGNYVIKRVGYDHVSSELTASDVRGRTAHVLIPFDATETGKVTLVAKGQKLQLRARAFEDVGTFNVGDEVVILHMKGTEVEVVKAN